MNKFIWCNADVVIIMKNILNHVKEKGKQYNNVRIVELRKFQHDAWWDNRTAKKVHYLRQLTSVQPVWQERAKDLKENKKKKKKKDVITQSPGIQQQPY